MTPEQFTRDANAWLDAVIAISPKIITTIGSVLGIFAFVKGRWNEKRLNGQSSKIDTLLLNTPPPAPPAVAPAPARADVTTNNNPPPDQSS